MCNCNNNQRSLTSCGPCNQCTPCTTCAPNTSTQDHSPTLLDCNTLSDTMEGLKERFETCKTLSASDMDLMVDLMYSIQQCPNELINDTNNIIVEFTPQAVLLESEVHSSINLLPEFTVTENEIAVFTIMVDNVQHKYMSKLGKGVYGLGGDTLFALGDIYLLSKESTSNNKFKVINFGNAASPFDGPVDISDFINNLPDNATDYKTIQEDEIPLFVGYVSRGRAGSSFNKYVVNGYGKGIYGQGGNITLVSSDLELVYTEVFGGESIPILTDDPNAEVVDLGEIGGADFIDVINGLPQFTIVAGTNYYFEYTVSGVRYVYGFDGANGTYGTGGTAMTTLDLFLIYDENSSAIEYHEGYIESGIRADGTLKVAVGDFDSSNNGTYININDDDEEIRLNAEKVTAPKLDIIDIDSGVDKTLTTKEWVLANAGSSPFESGTGTFSAKLIGVTNTVNGYSAASIGYDNNVKGEASFATGTGNIVSGDWSAAFGDTNTVAAYSGLATGSQNVLNNNYGFATGTGHVIKADYGAAIGRDCTVNGAIATAIGYNCIAEGDDSISTGKGNTSQSSAEIVIGAYSTNYTPTNTSTDRAFNVGNGINDANRSDAFTIYKNGGVLFHPTTTPTNPSAGMVYYDSSTNKLRCYDGTIWNDMF